MKQYLLLLFISSGLLLSSCKKEKPAPISNTELISGKAWKLVAFTQTLSTGQVQDIFAPMSACYRDDEFLYRANLSFEANAGVVRCNDSDPQIVSSGTWKFIHNETAVERTVTSGSGIGTTTFTVTALTTTTLELRATDGGIQYDLGFSH